MASTSFLAQARRASDSASSFEAASAFRRAFASSHSARVTTADADACCRFPSLALNSSSHFTSSARRFAAFSEELKAAAPAPPGCRPPPAWMRASSSASTLPGGPSRGWWLFFMGLPSGASNGLPSGPTATSSPRASAASASVSCRALVLAASCDCFANSACCLYRSLIFSTCSCCSTGNLDSSALGMRSSRRTPSRASSEGKAASMGCFGSSKSSTLLQ
mmetsp:Transcript_15356/g.30791  ORF Transcript_15356/g.30791 Transcript_15356/m.30791 type:complete len:220 (-) Transcript_15356:242-901(-)